MRAVLLTCLAMLWVVPCAAQAKWSLTMITSSSRFTTAYHDTSSPQVRVKPWRPTSLGVRLARDGARFGVGATLAFLNGDEAAEVDGQVLLPDVTVSALSLSPEIRWRALRTARDAELMFHTGPTLDVWKPSGADHRARLGAVGGATLMLPLTTMWHVELRGEVGFTSSYVNDDETTDQVRRNTSMRRATLGLGITKRL